MIHSDPFSVTGNDLHNLDSKKADKHEIYSLTSRLDSLEHSLREVRTEIDGLRGRCEELQASQMNLEIQLQREKDKSV